MTIQELFTKYQNIASRSTFKIVLQNTRNWIKSSEIKTSSMGIYNADIIYFIISLRTSLNKNNT